MSYALLPSGDLHLTFEDNSSMFISAYADGVARVRWYPRGVMHPHMQRTWSFVDRDGACPPEGWQRDALSAVIADRFPQQALSVTEHDGRLHLTLGEITIIAALSHPCLAWQIAGRAVCSDNVLIGYVHDARTGRIAHTLSRDLADCYYGFGEKSGKLNKHSRYLRMRSTDALGYDAEHSDPLYKHVPFYLTLNGYGAAMRVYGLFYDTPYECAFDMGAEIDNYYGDYRVFRAEGGDLDYWFIAGESLEGVLRRYTALTGRQTLPPRDSLGYQGNGMHWLEGDDPTSALAQFTAKLRAYDVPCSSFSLGSGYTRAADHKRYVFTWARDRIPEPAALIGVLKAAGLSVAANVKPGILTTHPRFEDAKAAGLLIRRADSESPDLAPWWSGEAAHLDFTNPQTIAWWKAQLKAELFAYGVDYPWNDNNEYNVRHDLARCHAFGADLPLMALRPVQTLLMALASFEAVREHYPERRPFVTSRAVAAGVQRYAATWTGDNRSDWKSLQYNIPMGMGLGLSGFANFGHDVGGFAGEPPDAELFLRWVQSCLFTPRFTINAWYRACEEAPWMHESVLPEVREALRFRYAMIPYLYSLLYAAEQTGAPVIRPTVYHFWDDPNTRDQSFEYMVGAWLLAAPVYRQGERVREIYLPRGADWYDWQSGACHEGGTTIRLDAPLSRLPLLARAGALIPTEHDGKRRVYVFPPRGAGESAFDLFEDDGVSLAYRQGAYRLIHLRMQTDERQIILRADAEVEWQLPAGERRALIVQER
jgi:alpha-glucosidase